MSAIGKTAWGAGCSNTSPCHPGRAAIRDLPEPLCSDRRNETGGSRLKAGMTGCEGCRNTPIPACGSEGMSRARGSSPGDYGVCFIVMEPDKAPARGDVLYGLDRLADATSTQPVKAGRLSVVRPRDSCPRGTAPTGSPECAKSRLFAAARCVKPRPLGTPPPLPNPTRRPPALEESAEYGGRAGGWG